ncbi:hypothetical protein IT6_00625 [Methylacidiphilum caldifontis]|nr:hypothetical protein IT6_00625 [Methylacidiphilum caldifontis]
MHVHKKTSKSHSVVKKKEQKSAEIIPYRFYSAFWHYCCSFLKKLLISFIVSLLGIVLAIFLYLRFFGFPPQVKQLVLSELESRGMIISLDKLSIDPRGNLVANRVIVFREKDRQSIWLQVDKVHLSVDWYSWLKGNPLIQSAVVSNATIDIPLSPHNEIEIHQVNASVNLNADEIEIKKAKGRVLNLNFDLKGKIVINGFPLFKPLTEEQIQFLDSLWSKILSIVDLFETQKPLQLEGSFSLNTKDPENVTASLQLYSKKFLFKDVPIENAFSELKIAGGAIKFEELTLELPRGQISSWGEVDFKGSSSFFEFLSSADLSLIKSILPKNWQSLTETLKFTDLPTFSGRFTTKWGTQKMTNLIVDIRCHNFSFQDHALKELSLPIAYDGKKLFAPELKLKTDTGILSGEILWDRQNDSFWAKINSQQINPKIFKKVFGTEFDRILDVTEFKKEFPIVNFEIRGNSLNPQHWIFSGHYLLKDFVYQGVFISSTESDFHFSNFELFLPNLHVSRPEGTVSGTVRHNFQKKLVWITDLCSSVNVIESAPALGNEFFSYVKPYRFHAPPFLKVNGVVDIDKYSKEPRTDLHIDVDSNSIMDFDIFKVTFPLTKPKGEIILKGRELTIKVHHGYLFDGLIQGIYESSLWKKNIPFRTNFHINNGDFHKAMLTIFNIDKDSGRFNFQTSFGGHLGDLYSLKGDGKINIHDGYIMSIPFLGIISQALSSKDTEFAMAKADEASGHFNIKDGFIITRDLKISSFTFSVLGSGKYNFVKDNLDMDMKVTMRGPIGYLFYPLSELFEFHGTGKLASPVWKSKVF